MSAKTKRNRKAWMTTRKPWSTLEQRQVLNTCAACGTHFEPMEELVEHLDEYGNVVERFHLDCAPRRR